MLPIICRSHIVKATELRLLAKFHDDWSKQSGSNATSPNYANYEVTHALTFLSILPNVIIIKVQLFFSLFTTPFISTLGTFER